MTTATDTYRDALIKLLAVDARENGSTVEMLIETLQHGCTGWFKMSLKDLEDYTLDAYEHLRSEDEECSHYGGLNDKQFLKKLINIQLDIVINNSVEIIAESEV